MRIFNYLFIQCFSVCSQNTENCSKIIAKDTTGRLHKYTTKCPGRNQVATSLVSLDDAFPLK